MIDTTAIANLQMLMNTGDGRQAVLAELLLNKKTSRSATVIKKRPETKRCLQGRISRIGASKAQLRQLRVGRLHPLTTSPLPVNSQLRITNTIIQQLDRLSGEEKEPLIKFAEGFAYHYNNLFMAVLGHISIVMFKLRPSRPAFSRLRECEELIHNTALLIRLLVEVFHRPQQAPAMAYPIDLTDREIGDRIFSMINKQSTSATKVEDNLGVQKILRIVAAAMAKRMKGVLRTLEARTAEIFRDRDLHARYGGHSRKIGIHLQRGIRIADALLDFATPQAPQTFSLDLNAAAREAVAMYSECFSGLRITLECSAGPLVVKSDSCRLRKLILELLANADDACPEGGEVCLKITKQNVTDPPELSINTSKLRKAHLTVEDNGPGMPACLGIHAFDPFTCAAVGRRRKGLGLAVVSGIVRAHGGRIRYFNRPSGGFVIDIELPLENKTEQPPAVDFPLP